jgi:hypothetical protein
MRNADRKCGRVGLVVKIGWVGLECLLSVRTETEWELRSDLMR